MLGLRFGLPFTLEPMAKLMLSAKFRAMLVLILMFKLTFKLTPPGAVFGQRRRGSASGRRPAGTRPSSIKVPALATR